MREALRGLAVALSLTALGGCALLEGETAEQDVYGAGMAYIAVGNAILSYVQLPECSQDQPPPCADPQIKQHLKNLDNVAYNALQTAQAIVRSNPDGLDAMLAVSKAWETVLALETALLDAGILDDAVTKAIAGE